MRRSAHPATRYAIPAAAAACVAVAAVELGLVPPLRHAWALNLWRYLPLPVALALAALTVALCLPRPRAALAERLPARIARALLPDTPLGGAALAGSAAILLWLLRERRLYGDSNILLYNAASGSEFLFPDIGATYLFQLCQRLGTSLGVPGRVVVQAAVAIAGGVTVLCFSRVARRLAPTREAGVLCLLLVLGGGLLRVLAGHVEVYAFVLLCAGAYFWSALAFLARRCGFVWPALALGTGLWMHLSFSFLAPSLLVLLWLRDGARSGRPMRKRVASFARRALLAALVAAAPVALFLLAMLAGGHTAELEQAGRTLLQWGGLEPSPVGHEAFLRGPLAEPGAGTRYAMLSLAHLKYLGNALFLLTPTAVPVLVAVALLAPWRFGATPEAGFLATAAGFMLLYAIVVRPVWGPYDWDLFSLTAVSLACLAAHLLARALPGPVLRELGVLLVAATLLFVTAPFLAIGIAPARDAGPFAFDGLEAQAGESPIDAFERRLGPWL